VFKPPFTPLFIGLQTIWELYYDDSTDAYGLGDFGDKVRALQVYMMSTDHLHSEHGTTGYFGPDTQKALSNWQVSIESRANLRLWGPRYSKNWGMNRFRTIGLRRFEILTFSEER
jgi:hypothetical protein